MHHQPFGGANHKGISVNQLRRPLVTLVKRRCPFKPSGVWPCLKLNDPTEKHENTRYWHQRKRRRPNGRRSTQRITAPWLSTPPEPTPGLAAEREFDTRRGVEPEPALHDHATEKIPTAVARRRGPSCQRPFRHRSDPSTAINTPTAHSSGCNQALRDRWQSLFPWVQALLSRCTIRRHSPPISDLIRGWSEGHRQEPRQRTKDTGMRAISNECRSVPPATARPDH